ncbi:MAG TPA: CSLREA domain-containing protein, partial [Thermoleophilia bacterium]
MIRSLIVGLLATLTLLVAGGATQVAAANSTANQLNIAVPARVDAGSTAAISVSLPSGVAAVDGRIFFDTSNAEVAGIAPVGSGQALDPQQISGGFAFGAYDMRASGGKNQIRIAVVANSAGRLPFRIVLDTAADASGAQLALGAVRGTGSLVFGSSSIVFAQPADAAPRQPSRAAGLTRDLVPDGRLAVTDVDIARAAWEQAELNGNPCAADSTGGDANGDGCVNIVDVQAVLAHQSWNVSNGLAVSAPSSHSASSSTNAAPNVNSGAAAAAGATFTVNSTADTNDAKFGDGICADAQGHCTLRAAITEANWNSGTNTIAFNLPGTAPVTIQLSTSLPQFVLQDRT